MAVKRAVKEARRRQECERMTAAGNSFTDRAEAFRFADKMLPGIFCKKVKVCPFCQKLHVTR